MSGPPIGQFTGKSHIALGTIYGGKVTGNLTGRFISPVRADYISGILSGQNGAVQPVLADLDGDGIPEIILQGAGSVYAYKKDGTLFPGWPVNLKLPDHTDSTDPIAVDYSPQPAVGDIDGDGQPDIVVTYAGYVAAYNRFGKLIPGFPKNLNSDPKVNCDFDQIDFTTMNPAIADIDGDGFNELIVGGSRFPCDSSPVVPSLFVYDLGGFPGGRVEWGQFRGNPERTGIYKGAISGAPDVDIGYTITYPQAGLITGQKNHAIVAITNHSPTAAANATFNLTFPNVSDESLVQVSSNDLHCLTLRGRYTCRTTSLGPSQEVSLDLTISSAVPVNTSADIQVSHDGYESKLDDNFGELSLDIAYPVVDIATQTFSAPENLSISAAIKVNISHATQLPLLTITQKPTEGFVVPFGPVGFSYTPKHGFAGTDSFDYKFTYNGTTYQGTVVVTVKAASQSGSGGGGNFGLFSMIALILIALGRRALASSGQGQSMG